MLEWGYWLIRFFEHLFEVPRCDDGQLLLGIVVGVSFQGHTNP